MRRDKVGRGLRGLSVAAAVLAAGAASLVTLPAAAASPSPKPTVIRAIQHDRSAPLGAMHGTPMSGRKPAKLPGHVTSTPPPSSLIGGDPVLQSTPPAASGPALAGSFEGIGDGIPGYNVNLAPSDVNGAIGPNHYVQIANASLAVFTRTGTILLGPEPISTLWTGFGGLCETTNGGDPIVLYDRNADRWLISQLAYQGSNGTSVPYFNCVAVSATNDPTGAYNRYAFPRTELPDYAKFSVWPDAYYMTDNDFQNGNSFTGATFAALDRNAMLAGGAATMIVFSIPFSSLLPAGQDGPTPPPAGSPGYALALNGTQGLAEFRLHADFVTPNNSTVTGPLIISGVAPYRELCNGFNSCVPQAGPGYYLASLGDRLMYRVAYRNFGDHESLVASHSVDPGGGGSISGGVRWYEVRDPGGSPALYQQGTFAPDSNFRWMGSVAMDARGDIAAGYSLSGPSMAPSIAMTGRLAGDPLGTLPQGETNVVQGSGVQTGTDRWGDYTSMAIDPVDDCTFWYTNQYLTTTGGFNWHTRVASFRYPSCALAASATTLTSSPNPSSGQAVTLTATVTGGATTPTGTVTFEDGNTVLASAPLTSGQASANVALLGGTRQLAAVYSGDGTYSGSSSPLVTQTVTLPASTTSVAASTSTSFAGNPVTFTATVTGSSPTGSVSFNDGGLTLASVALSNGTATFTTGSLSVGSHSVSATYSGDTANASSSSGALSLTVGGPAYSLLYSFTGGADNGAPQSGLTQGPDGAFYGVTSVQGSSTYGTIFRFTPSGGVTTLHTFAPADGGVSRSRLLVGADGALYGTSQSSSTNGGTVWKITTQGAFTVLHTFAGADGHDPSGGLVQDAAGNLYGWTVNGGQFSCGNAYSLSPTGVFTSLYSFTCGDGSGPQGAPVFGADGNLYGVTFLGGAHNQGTVFTLTTSGALTTLYAFQDSTDGALPQAGLLLGADGNFYGTTSVGAGGRGTIFRVTPAGTFTLIYSLTPGDGAAPLSGLVQDSKGNLYGETAFTNPGSPVNQSGSIFEVTSAGTFVQLKSLLTSSLGQQPRGGLSIASDGTIYGTDDQGGTYGLGGIFSIAPPGPLTLAPATLSNLSEGFNFSLQVASVSGGAAPYAGTIDWGDGTTSAATFNASVVGGRHTWAEESPSSTPYTVKVTVTDTSGQSASVTDSAAVADAGINVNPPSNQTATEGVQWSGTLAAFTDVDPGGVVSDYTATIDWTDGTVTSGTVSGTGPFSVGGSHTYRTAGNHSAIVTFTDAGGASNYVVIGFTVGDAALSGSANAITGSESSTTSATVASFSDANAFSQSTDFTATITWGDGSTSTGTISGSNGTFIVTGSHQYGEAGTYVTSVHIADVGGSSLTVSGSATISDYPISVTGLKVSSKKNFTGKVATLSDGDLSAGASDYRVTINWGDGTTSSGTVSGSANPFTISGAHNYTKNATYTVTITVTDNGGATAKGTSTLTVH